jgi:phage shock protein A
MVISFFESMLSKILEFNKYLKQDLVTVRQSYAEVTASQRRLLKQKEQADAVANDWYKRAQLALEKGNDALAKEALLRRQTATEEADNLQQQLNIQNTSIDKLYDGMVLLEKKILESKAKKDQMVARARTAQSTQKINDMISGITGKTSMDAFKRMEDKVEALEASAEVSKEMTSLGQLPGTSDIEREFKLLEASSSVDAELAAMKKNLLTGSPTSSPESSTSAKSVDNEFEKLRREAGL